MKKVKIGGQEFTLKGKKEVTYGAQKEVDDIKQEAALEMLTPEAILDLIRGKHTKGGGDVEKLTNAQLLERVPKAEIRKAITNSQKIALAPDVEAIMLSANLTRDEIFEMPVEMVGELAIAADKELGGLANFTKTLTSDTT